MQNPNNLTWQYWIQFDSILNIMFYLPKITLKITKMIFTIKFVPRSLDYINTKHVDIINLTFIYFFIYFYSYNGN